MSKHTPGPWRAEDRLGHSDGPKAVITADSVDRIAIVSLRGVLGDDEAEANANLIAAAPEMYEALKGMTNTDHEPEYHHQAMGCGLEDRNITDRYDAMLYGWNKAIERMYEMVLGYSEEAIAKAEGGDK